MTNDILPVVKLPLLLIRKRDIPAPAPMQLLTFKTLALDPNWKLAYARTKWSKENFNAGVQHLENVVQPFHV